jgi:hypothetical protein
MSISRYADLQSLIELKSVDAIIGCRRHGAFQWLWLSPKQLPCFPPATLIRLYELLKNDSRSFERTRQQAQSLLTNTLNIGMVEVNGIEPMTPCLQSRCSPS